MMKPKSRFRFLLFFVLILLLATTAIFATAQGDNLLRNPRFENGFTNFEGVQPRDVANRWMPWNAERTPDMDSFENVPPKYASAANSANLGVTPRIRSGEDAQVYWSFFETHDAGVYQEVSGVTIGSELRFSIYVYVWSSTFSDNPDLSDTPGDVTVRVGIDPTGGTDADSDTVVWSTPFVEYDLYRQYAISAVAESDTVTVFVRSTVALPVQNTYIYLDDAVLESSTDATGPDTQPTEEPSSDDPTPTQEVQPTEVSAVATATSEPTEEPPTEEPPTEEPPTDVPTATAIPTEVPPTLVPSPTAIPTEVPPTEEPPTEVPPPTDEPTAEPPTDVPTEETPLQDEPQGPTVYLVQAGDTLEGIAIQNNTSIDAILAANGLQATSILYIGQELIIPSPSDTTVTEPTEEATPEATQEPVTEVTDEPVEETQEPTAEPTDEQPGTGTGTGEATPEPVETEAPTDEGEPAETETTPEPTEAEPVTDEGTPEIVTPAVTHRVTYGETLSTIAQRYGTTVTELMQLNNIVNPNLIVLGQELIIEPPKDAEGNPIVDSEPQTYVVQPGDTLYQIAARFGVKTSDLAEANGITNYNLIYVGQRLTIP